MDHRDAQSPQQHGRRFSAPRRVATHPGQAPRQEYLDAFDDARFGRRIPAQRAHHAEAAGGARPGGRGPGDSAPGGGGPQPAARRRESWSRTLLGVGSAAVVTVLLVMTAARLADPGTDARADGEQPAATHSQDQERSSQQGEQESTGGAGGADSGEQQLSYEEWLGTVSTMQADYTGSGELVPVGGSDPAPDPDADTVVRYRVDVEADLGEDMDPEYFAEAVHRTLNDDRSWTNGGQRSFARVSDGRYDFVVTLASPGTTADWCAKSGLDTTVENVSCNSSSTERVMINAWRWAHGSSTYGDDIGGYRQMLINHEVGHRLGYGHVACPSEGALAPVMMQQTKFLTTDGVTCRPNPWPNPEN